MCVQALNIFKHYELGQLGAGCWISAYELGAGFQPVLPLVPTTRPLQRTFAQRLFGPDGAEGALASGFTAPRMLPSIVVMCSSLKRGCDEQDTTGNCVVIVVAYLGLASLGFADAH